MDHSAKPSTKKHCDRVTARLHADALGVLARLDLEIAALRRLAPADYANTITALKETADEIREAIGGLGPPDLV